MQTVNRQILPATVRARMKAKRAPLMLLTALLAVGSGLTSLFAAGGGENIRTLDTINHSATPSQTLHSITTSISPDSTYSPGTRNMPEAYYVSGYYSNRLAILIKTRFTVATAGEYVFNPFQGRS